MSTSDQTPDRQPAEGGDDEVDAPSTASGTGNEGDAGTDMITNTGADADAAEGEGGTAPTG